MRRTSGTLESRETPYLGEHLGLPGVTDCLSFLCTMLPSAGQNKVAQVEFRRKKVFAQIRVIRLVTSLTELRQVLLPQLKVRYTLAPPPRHPNGALQPLLCWLCHHRTAVQPCKLVWGRGTQSVYQVP